MSRLVVGSIAVVGIVAVTLYAQEKLPAKPQAQAHPPSTCAPRGLRAEIGSPRLQHGRGVNAIQFSRDGKQLYSASDDFTVREWDVTTGNEVRVFASDRAKVRDLTLTTNEKLLVMATEKEGILVWDLITGKLVRQLGVDDGDHLALASVDGELFSVSGNGVHCWNLATGKRQSELETGDNAVTRLAIARDGKQLAGLAQSKVLLWNIETKELVRSLQATSDLSAFAFSPDGEHLATSQVNGDVVVWDVSTGQVNRRIALPKRSVTWRSLAFSRNGKTIFTGGQDGYLHALDWKETDQQFLVRAQFGPVACLAVSPDGMTIATGGGRAKAVWDHSIHLWDAQQGSKLPQTDRATVDIPSVLAVSPDGKKVVKGCFNKRFAIWEESSNKLGAQVILPDAYSRVTVALSPDGKTFAAGGANRIQLHDAGTGRTINELEMVGAAGDASGMCYTPDGKRLIVGTTAGWLLVWDVGLRRLIYQIKKAHDKEIWTLDCSPDGHSFATGGFDGAVAFWSTETGQSRFKHKAHRSLVRSVKFSADGMRLASAANDDVLIVWESATGKEVCAFDTGWALSSVDFCQQDRVVVAGHYYDRLDMWDIATGKKVETLRNRPGPFTSDVMVDRNGRWLWTADSDSVVRKWDLPLLLEQVPTLPKPVLTKAEAEQQWRDLADMDPAVANSAIWTMAAGGDAAITLLHERFATATDANNQRKRDDELRKLIRDLDDDEFQVREAATAHLLQLGPSILPTLEENVVSTTSPEVRFRLSAVIRRLKAFDPLTNVSQDEVRLARAIQVLAHLPKPVAIELIETLRLDVLPGLPAEQARAALAKLKQESNGGR